MAQNDSRTNIAVAEASWRIAFETKRDSDTLKTIAASTIVFLSATLVAVSTSTLSYPSRCLIQSRSDPFRDGLLQC